MNIIVWLVVGGLAGWIASKVMKTDAEMGLLANVVVGVVGALLGGWLAGVLFDLDVSMETFNWTSFFVAIVGAVVFLAVLKAVRR